MAEYIRPANAAELIKAVRADKIVGVGTCSPIDECFGDDELLQFLCYEDFDGGANYSCTVKRAIKDTRAYHRRWKERERECQYE